MAEPDHDGGRRAPSATWRLTSSEVGDAGRQLARGPRGAVAHKATITDHTTLEEEIAQLRARIGILMRAGTDYRRQVDELFVSTKEEARAEIAERDARIHDLTTELEAVSRDLAQERVSLQHAAEQLGEARQEVEEERRATDAERERAQAALAAQQRVESELDAAGRQLEEMQNASDKAARAVSESDARHANEIEQLRRQVQDEQQATEAAAQAVADCEEALRQAEQQAHRADDRAQNAERLADDRKALIGQRDAAQLESDRLHELVQALQERQLEVETELNAARRRLDEDMATRPGLMRAEQERDRISAEHAALADRARRLEEQNRVLHRQSDRRRLEAEELAQQLEAGRTELDRLRAEVASHVAKESVDAAADAVKPSATAPQLRDAGVECCLPTAQTAAAPGVSEEAAQALREAALLREERQLLCDERVHERAQDEQVRQLCEELSAEVSRLTSDNLVLRDGLAMIEDCFGRFIPPEMKGRLDDSLAGLADGGAVQWPPEPSGAQSPSLRAPAEAPAVISSREVFTQTLSSDAPAPPPPAIGFGGEGVWAEGATMEVSREAWHRVEMLELEGAQLRQQHQLLQDAAAAAFRQSVIELLRRVGSNPEVTDLRVDVHWPDSAPTRAVQTPRAAAAAAAAASMGSVPHGQLRGWHSAAVSPQRGETDALRKALRRAADAEASADAAAVASRQLAEENSDLHSQLRSIVDTDPLARDAVGLGSAALRSVEQRVNAHLDRWRGVLRRRAGLVQRVCSTFRMVAEARCTASEALAFTQPVRAHADESSPRVSRCIDLLLEAEAAQRAVAAEFLTDWERAGLGMLGTESKASALGTSHDLVAALREQDELLRTLHVAIEPPMGPRRMSRGYSFVSGYPPAPERPLPMISVGPRDDESESGQWQTTPQARSPAPARHTRARAIPARYDR
eukprot:TRINITY_DN28722_c0_g1_i1.p1 TRINITY_DN28722_c0_g1~~TRINITY_DN28722_c0_g1_i1.p1  ORF type:complete len:992 (+),score=309.30 TRINITY_DN28722_c0_g1_i1:207-2978(+)